MPEEVQVERQLVALLEEQEEELVQQIRQKDRQQQEQQVVVDWQGQGEPEVGHTYPLVAAGEEQVVAHTCPLPEEEPEVDRTFPWQAVVVVAVDPSFPSVVAAAEAGRYSSQA